MISEQLDKLITESGKQIKEIARDTGIAPNTIWIIRSGKNVNPRLNTLMHLAYYFGTSLDELCDFDEFLNSR